MRFTCSGSIVLTSIALLAACDDGGSSGSGGSGSGSTAKTGALSSTGASGTGVAPGTGGGIGEGAGDGVGGGGGQVDVACANRIAQLEAEMAATLDAAAVDTEITTQPAFTLLLETEGGRRFTHSHGDSTAETVYESASTSKWVTAVVILDLVDRGVLSLDTTAGSLVPFWNEDEVDLRDLMSFTSGYGDEPLCLNNPAADFTECAQKIFDEAVDPAPPGSEYRYASTHLQIAGLMAIAAVDASDWGEVFAGFQERTGLFPDAAYDLPSVTNPRLAGGMHWTGEAYLAFLRGLAHGDLLSTSSREALFADQRGDAAVVASPIWEMIAEDWSYGLGNWLECPDATLPESFDCGAGHRNSSPGAYGAYPFIDFDEGYFGIVARQGELQSGAEGVAIFRTVEDLAAEWSAISCD